MPSLLVFAKPDNVHPDPEIDRQKFKRGHVIDAKDDDNFFWGKDIEKLGFWKVIVVSAAPVGKFWRNWVKLGKGATAGELRREMLDLDAVLADASAKSAHTVKVKHSKLKVIQHGR